MYSTSIKWERHFAVAGKWEMEILMQGVVWYIVAFTYLETWWWVRLVEGSIWLDSGAESSTPSCRVNQMGLFFQHHTCSMLTLFSNLSQKHFIRVMCVSYHFFEYYRFLKLWVVKIPEILQVSIPVFIKMMISWWRWRDALKKLRVVETCCCFWCRSSVEML